MTKRFLVGLSALALAACAHQPVETEVAAASEPAAPAAMSMDANPLFWPREQRAMGFRAIDQLPALAQARVIPAGSGAYPLPEGAPLDLGEFNLEAFMESQQTAAVVVLHDGDIVLERYGLGFGPTGRWTSFSVAKSLTSSLVGAAVQDGFIESLDDPVTRYIEDLRGSAYGDVSVRQLLTMTSGIRWNESYTDPDSDVARFNAHVPSPGMDATVSYMRTLERAHPPGERWHYSTGETNLIGVLVSEATGRPLAEYLSEKIWQPFGMQQDATWLLGPTGHEIAGCCIQAATRDMARFGLFVLGDGVAGGERIVPEGWFAEATSPQVQLDGERAGYGYQWWTYGAGTFAANGIFGQGIFIDPERDLVIAYNSNWAQASGGDGPRERNAFIRAVQAAVDAR